MSSNSPSPDSDAADSPLDDHTGEFVSLLTSNQAALELYIRSLLPGERGIDEVVQQTNTKIWSKRAEFQLGTHFKAWAFAIARFEVLNHRKQQARQARIRFSDELEDLISTEADALSFQLVEKREALQSCLEAMKPRNRELLLARYSSNENLTEFANRLDRSAGGVKVALYRLRTQLQECIEKRLRAEGEN